MTQLVVYNVFNGLIIGAFYALMALGLSLILNLSGVINFAHGGFLAIGGYLAFLLIPFIGFWGALVISPILTAIIGLFLPSCFFVPRLGFADRLQLLQGHLHQLLLGSHVLLRAFPHHARQHLHAVLRRFPVARAALRRRGYDLCCQIQELLLPLMKPSMPRRASSTACVMACIPLPSTHFAIARVSFPWLPPAFPSAT